MGHFPCLMTGWYCAVLGFGTITLLAACGETSRTSATVPAMAATSTTSGAASSGGAGGESAETTSAGGRDASAPPQVEGCAAPSEAGFTQLAKLSQTPGALTGDEASVYFAVAGTVYRSPIGDGCVEALVTLSGTVSQLQYSSGRLFALANGAGERGVYSLSVTGAVRAELVAYVEGRALVDIREFAVLDQQLYLLQTLEFTRVDLETRETTGIELSLPGGAEHLTSDGDRLYWAHGGRVWSGDIDPWVGYGVASIGNAESEPEVLSSAGCIGLSAGLGGLWCMSGPSVNDEGMLMGNYGDVVKIEEDGSPTKPVAESAYALAAGTDYLFVAWADAIAAYDQAAAGGPAHQAEISRPYRLTSNGKLAVLVTELDDMTWALSVWDPTGS